MEAFLPLLLLAALWLLMIRPQQQRVKRQRELLASLTIGEDVVTVGGIVGHIVALDDEKAGLRVADGVVIEVLRGAIGQRLGTAPEPPASEPAGPAELDAPGGEEQQAG